MPLLQRGLLILGLDFEIASPWSLYCPFFLSGSLLWLFPIVVACPPLLAEVAGLSTRTRVSMPLGACRIYVRIRRTRISRCLAASVGRDGKRLERLVGECEQPA